MRRQMQLKGGDGEAVGDPTVKGSPVPGALKKRPWRERTLRTGAPMRNGGPGNVCQTVR